MKGQADIYKLGLLALLLLAPFSYSDEVAVSEASLCDYLPLAAGNKWQSSQGDLIEIKSQFTVNGFTVWEMSVAYSSLSRKSARQESWSGTGRLYLVFSAGWFYQCTDRDALDSLPSIDASFSKWFPETLVHQSTYTLADGVYTVQVLTASAAYIVDPRGSEIFLGKYAGFMSLDGQQWTPTILGQCSDLFTLELAPCRNWLETGQTLSLSLPNAPSDAQFQWMKDGQPIPDETESAFTKPEAEATDSGYYSCIVTEAAKAWHETNPTKITIYPAGALPVVSTFAMVILAAAMAVCAVRKAKS